MSTSPFGESATDGVGGGVSGGGVSGGVDVESGSEWETVAVACQRIDTLDPLDESGEAGGVEHLEVSRHAEVNI